MSTSNDVLTDVAKVYYILSGCPEGAVDAIAAHSLPKSAVYFQRFLGQCKTFEVDPVWVLKVMFSSQPSSKKAVKLYYTNLTSDYAWQRFLLNYEQMKRQMEYKGNLNPTLNKLDDKDVIMGQIRHSISTLKEFKKSYMIQFTEKELLVNLASMLSPYHLASSKEAITLYKAKAFSPATARKIKEAFISMKKLKLLTFARNLVSGGGVQ